MRKLARQTVITYLCVVLMLVTPVGACIYCCNCGEVRPKDPYVLLNSTLNLTCRINSSLADHASNLFFVLNNSHRIPDEFIRIIDNKTIQLSKTVTSLNESGKYICRRRGVEGHESIVDQQLVELEYPLRNVTNFRCEVHDWDVNKTCTWDIGEYVDKSNINVTLLGYNGHGHYCEIQFKTKCIWPNPTESKNRVVINAGTPWFYVIKVQNIRTNQTTTSKLFQREVNKIVRPAQVRNVQATNSVERDCVTLHWKYPRPNRQQSARIQYFSKRASLRTLLLDHRESNYTICNLTAYTNYTFSIQIRPQTESGNLTGHWSVPVSITHRTRLDYPSQAPIISSGCYLNNHEQCLKEIAYRNVTVFWKSIAESEVNGDNIYYKISCQEITGNQNIVRNITKPKMIADLELKCNKAYSVKIYTGNEFGLSEHYGSLMIPPAGNVERPTNVMVEIDDKIVNISWTYTGKELANFTIFWCSKMRLNKEVSWQKVGYNKRFLVMDWHKFRDIDDLKYGVSADLDRNISSGFEWRFCKFRINEAPAPPRKVSILSEIDGLLVNWIPPYCDEKSSKPVKYQLTWCPADRNSPVCQGQNNSIIIYEKDLIDYTYHITDVVLSQTYGITINSISQRNFTSMPTAMVYGRPSGSKMPPGQIAGIAVGSMVVMVMVIAGIVFILRNCCAQIKDLIHPPPIVVPFVPTTTNQTEGPATIYYGNNYESYRVSPETKYSPLSNPAYMNGGAGGKSFQFQFSMDSGRGSLPVDDLILNTPDPETRSQPSSPTEVLNGVPMQSITVQENLTVNSVMKTDLSLAANESTAGTSSHPFSAYHAISQHSMSDLSTDSSEMSDEDSGLSDKSEDGDIKPYVKAGTKNIELDSGGQIHEQLMNSMRNQDPASTDVPSWEQDNCSLDLYIENKFRDTNDIVLTQSVGDEATDVNNSLLTQALQSQITDVNDNLLTQMPQDQTSELNDSLLTQASGDETARDLSLMQSSNDVTNQQISDLSEHLGDVDQISLHSHELSVVTSSQLHPCDLNAKAPQDILELPKLECVNILDEKKEEHCDEYQLRFDEMCDDSSNDSSLSESDIDSQSERMAQQDTSHLDYVSVDFNTYSCDSSNYSQNNYIESCAMSS